MTAKLLSCKIYIFSLMMLLFSAYSGNKAAFSFEPVKLPSTLLLSAANTKITSAETGNTLVKHSKIKAEGETGQKIEEYRKTAVKSSSYTLWKRRLPFWIRKLVIFSELAFYIIIGVILGQMLEVAGAIRYIAIITRPFLWLGRLPEVAGPPFILSLQSGAVANSMLVSARDEGELSNRQLYTSVLVVSSLSLFAHLPTYIIPLAVAFGSYSAWLFFSVRFGAIISEIIIILLFSNYVIRHFTGDKTIIIPEEERLEKKTGKNAGNSGYFSKVWLRSRKTIKRILLYTVPSFFGLAILEYFGVFNWLKDEIPGIFTYSFLPPEAAAIIPAQAINLYNGIITAGNFLDEEKITAVQAVIILLAGSIITSPIRTLKHALPTYIGILGPKPGIILAIAAQLLRILFIGAAIVITMLCFSMI